MPQVIDEKAQEKAFQLSLDFERYLTQTYSVAMTLSSNPNIGDMDKKDLGGCLWVILDRLDDLSETNQKLYEIIRGKEGEAS